MFHTLEECKKIMQLKCTSAIFFIKKIVCSLHDSVMLKEAREVCLSKFMRH